jgi:hypothetical protein
MFMRGKQIGGNRVENLTASELEQREILGWLNLATYVVAIKVQCCCDCTNLKQKQFTTWTDTNRFRHTSFGNPILFLLKVLTWILVRLWGSRLLHCSQYCSLSKKFTSCFVEIIQNPDIAVLTLFIWYLRALSCTFLSMSNFPSTPKTAKLKEEINVIVRLLPFPQSGKEQNITWEQTMVGKKGETDKKYSTNNEILLTIGISFHQIAALPSKKGNKNSSYLIFDDSLMFSMWFEDCGCAIKNVRAPFMYIFGALNTECKLSLPSSFPPQTPWIRLF